MTARTTCGNVNILSFDIEEYFHVEAARVDPAQWPAYESRLAPSVERILEMLCASGAGATFFVLGWVAARHKKLIRQIAEQGHEIASHGNEHRMIGKQSPEQFLADLDTATQMLQDITGKRVLGYRAPTFSVTHRTAWALDVLEQAGYQYDSSVFPIRHDRYGVRQAPARPHYAITPSGSRILEIPPLTLDIAWARLPMGGGGYLRLWPTWLVGGAIAIAQRKNIPAMIYLHPWEMDPDQPVLVMSRLSRWRHRLNLTKTSAKLDCLLRKFTFTSVQSQLQTLQRVTSTYRYG